MPSRKQHTKSRHGCAKCKARKIKVGGPDWKTTLETNLSWKCDEKRPACTRCCIREEDCFYGLEVYQKRPQRASSSSEATFSESHNLPESLLHDIIAFPVLSTTQDDDTSADLSTSRDLHLLHHFTVSAVNLPTTHYPDIWRLTAPQEAFDKPFLMHGILAMSALHLAHVHPSASRRWINEAVHHYTSAVSLFSSVITDINADNAVAAFLLSALILCISYAMPPDPSQSTPSATEALEHIFGLFRLQRGIKQVLDASRGFFRDSPVSTMLKVPFANDLPLPADDEAMLQSIEQRVKAEPNILELLRESYMMAIDGLRKCYPVKGKERDHQNAMLGWPVRVSAEFFDAAVAKKPIAVAILAIYGILLHALKNVWWIGDKGKMLVSASSSLLPPEWEDLVAWVRLRVDFDDHP